MMELLISNVPMFASGEKRRGKFVVYQDKDGQDACCNFATRTDPRICCICHNVCVQYVVDDYGEYTCSACGKFPRELLLQ